MVLPVPPPPLQRHDYLYKIILIGDQSVGKTNLMMRFCDGTFGPTYIGTVGIDFKVRTIEIDGKKIKLQLWDTAGQERFQCIAQVYYRGAQGVIFVYEITRRKSFENLRRWIQTYQDISGYGARKLIIGNKSDLFDNREVEWEEADRVAKVHGCQLFEASAKNGYNVENAFLALAREIKEHQERRVDDLQPESGVKIRKAQLHKSKSICPKCNLL